jgi:hypothetical protein
LGRQRPASSGAKKFYFTQILEFRNYLPNQIPKHFFSQSPKGVRAVLAKSFERIHRSNLIGMGILPLQFVAGQDADYLELNGSEHFDIEIPKGSLKPGQRLMVKVVGRDFAKYSYYVMVLYPWDISESV